MNKKAGRPARGRTTVAKSVTVPIKLIEQYKTKFKVETVPLSNLIAKKLLEEIEK